MNKKDITLINFIPTKDGQSWLPIGCLSLVSHLKRNNFTVDFRDYQLLKKGHTLKNMISFFKNPSDIIGIGCFSYMLPYAIRIAQTIKKEAPGKIIILGGIGPSLAAGEILNNFPWIDIIVFGDGYETLPELLKVVKSRESLESVKGIGYRKNFISFFTKERTTSTMLSHSFISGFKGISLKPYKRIPILSAEGCLYKCTFCCVPRYHKEHKKRDLNIIKEEILYLSKQKDVSEKFVLLDESFLSDRTRVYNFLDFAGGNLFKNKIGFECYGRINLMDKEIIKDLSKNNFTKIYYGIESGSNNILKKIKKAFTIEEAVKILLLTRKYFKKVPASFIYGYPFESKSDFQKTVIYYIYLASRNIATQLHLLCPLPGTELYKLYSKDLKFSQNLISDISSIIINNSEIKDMLIKYPHCFPTFYHYKSPSLKFKLNVIKSMFGKYIFPQHQ